MLSKPCHRDKDREVQQKWSRYAQQRVRIRRVSAALGLSLQVYETFGTNPIAHQLLKRFGSLSAVLEADPKDLATVEGVGKQAAAFLSMIPQVTRRYFQDRVSRDQPRLITPEAVAGYLVPLMAGRPEEVFYVLCLDTQCRVIYPALIGEGTVKEAQVHPRHVVEEAIRHRASSIILAHHNHPSGIVRPSNQDHQLTLHLVQALGALDIPVLDHIIVAGRQTYSFAREGVLPGFQSLVSETSSSKKG